MCPNFSLSFLGFSCQFIGNLPLPTLLSPVEYHMEGSFLRSDTYLLTLYVCWRTEIIYDAVYATKSLEGDGLPTALWSGLFELTESPIRRSQKKGVGPHFSVLGQTPLTPPSPERVFLSKCQ